MNTHLHHCEHIILMYLLPMLVHECEGYLYAEILLCKSSTECCQMGNMDSVVHV